VTYVPKHCVYCGFILNVLVGPSVKSKHQAGWYSENVSDSYSGETGSNPGCRLSVVKKIFVVLFNYPHESRESTAPSLLIHQI
jgi:hypothetical protein